MAKREYDFLTTIGFPKKATAEETTPKEVTLSIFKQGINGVVFPALFSWSTPLKVKQVILMSNVIGASFRIGTINYTATTIIGVELPADTEMSILDLTIKAGFDTGNAIIIFEKM